MIPSESIRIIIGIISDMQAEYQEPLSLLFASKAVKLYINIKYSKPGGISVYRLLTTKSLETNFVRKFDPIYFGQWYWLPF
jgi:hypothetical protein